MTSRGESSRSPARTGPGTLPAGRETRILSGAAIAAEVRERVVADVAAFHAREGFAPSLAVLLLGTDAPSAVYLEQILRTCGRVGIGGRRVEIPGEVSDASVRAALRELNADPRVAGVIVQQPLPDAVPLRAVIDTLDPAKDVDGICPQNAGLVSLGHPGFVSATAQAAVEMLTRSGYELDGLHAVVIGRSNIVGKPMALMLLQQNATVTICTSRTRDLARHTRDADILVVATGKPKMITGNMIKPGAAVIDVGINRLPDGKLCGDVDFESARKVAGWITPVPGGVGPMTITMLMANTVLAAERAAE